MTNTHTCTECSALLHVDLKTFRRWIEQAGIDLDSQVNTMDTRTRDVTQEQGEGLAHAHGRTLHTIDTRLVEVIPAIADALLVERVEVLEHQIRRIDDQFDELVTIMRTCGMALGRQDVRLAQRDDAQSTQIAALTEQITAPALDQKAQGNET